MAKKHEPDYNPFALTASSATPPAPIHPDAIIPSSSHGQWEIGEMKDKARADLVEQELMKLKGLVGEHEINELARYVAHNTDATLRDLVALRNQPRDPLAQELFDKFLQEQIKVYAPSVLHLQKETTEQIQNIATRPIHIDAEHEPKKKSFWERLTGE